VILYLLKLSIKWDVTIYIIITFKYNYINKVFI